MKIKLFLHATFLLVLAFLSAPSHAQTLPRLAPSSGGAPVAALRIDGTTVGSVSAISGGLGNLLKLTPLQLEMPPGAFPGMASWLATVTTARELSDIRLVGRGWETTGHGRHATVEYPGLDAAGITPLRLTIGLADVASVATASPPPNIVSPSQFSAIRVSANGVDFTGLLSMSNPTVRRSVMLRPGGAQNLLQLGEPENEPVRFVVPIERLAGFVTWAQAWDARDVHIEYLQAGGTKASGITLKLAKAMVGLAPVSAGNSTRNAEVVVEFDYIDIDGVVMAGAADRTWRDFSDGSGRARLGSVDYRLARWVSTGVPAPNASQKLVVVSAELEVLSANDLAESVGITLVDAQGTRVDNNNVLYRVTWSGNNEVVTAIEGQRALRTVVPFHAVAVVPREFEPRTVIIRPANSNDQNASFSIPAASIPPIPVPFADPAQPAVALSQVTVPPTGSSAMTYPMLSFDLVGTPTISSVSNATFGGVTGNFHVVTLTVRNGSATPQPLDDTTLSLRGNFANGTTDTSTFPYEQNSSAAVAVTLGAQGGGYTLRYIFPRQANNNLLNVVIGEGTSRTYLVGN